MAGELAHAHRFERGARPLVSLLLRYTLELESHVHVLQDRVPGKQRVLLEDERDILGRRPGNSPAVHEHLARARLQQSADDVQQRALAAAAGTQQADELVATDVQIDGLQRRQALGVAVTAEAPGDSPNADCNVHCGRKLHGCRRHHDRYSASPCLICSVVQRLQALQERGP